MSGIFYNTRKFNRNIGNWNVSNVTNMSGMFALAKTFNHDIGNWDVSKVTNMSRMFYHSIVFNQNIERWNVMNVTNMQHMFNHTKAFSQNIGIWNVSNVKNMSFMFDLSEKFNHDIGDWDVSNVTDMQYMFDGTLSFNQDIGRWDVSNVTNMQYMFYRAKVFDKNIGNWNVSKVESMLNMFVHALQFNQDIGRWDRSAARGTTADMFNGACRFDPTIQTGDTVHILIDSQYAVRSHRDDYSNMEDYQYNIEQVHGGRNGYEIHTHFMQSYPNFIKITEILNDYLFNDTSTVTFNNINKLIDEKTSPLNITNFISFVKKEDHLIDNWRVLSNYVSEILSLHSYKKNKDITGQFDYDKHRTAICKKIYLLRYSKHNHLLYKITLNGLLFILSDNFSIELQQSYCAAFIFACGSSYISGSENIRDNTYGLSCVTGIIERFTTTMKQLINDIGNNPEIGDIIRQIYLTDKIIATVESLDVLKWAKTHNTPIQKIYSDLDTNKVSREQYNANILTLFKKSNLPPNQISDVYYSSPSIINHLEYIPEFVIDYITSE